jgi:hypothetical protein
MKPASALPDARMEKSHKSDRALLNPEKLTYLVLIQLQNIKQLKPAFDLPDTRMEKNQKSD